MILAVLVHFSRFLYNMYQSEGLPSVHDTNQQRRWIRRLGREIGVEFCLTAASMMTRLYKRTSLVVSTARHLSHGRQREEFLRKEWQLNLSTDDFKPQREVALETELKVKAEKNRKLEQANAALEQSERTLKASGKSG